MFKAGSADAYLGALSVDSLADIAVAAKTGAGLLKLAKQHRGEEYRNVQVPKDDANWKGPWDCAEFVSWLVFQQAGILYGCLDDNASPSKADAYTGAWKSDVARLGKRVSVEQAAGTVGGLVLRYPPAPGTMGHIAVCDGKGGTVEAKGRRYGVVEDTVHGRLWDTGVLIPGISYDAAAAIEISLPVAVYKPDASNMNKGVVLSIQQALASKGFNPGPIDGDYGRETQAAVAAFQMAEGLVVDGAVGVETAAALGVSLTAEELGPAQSDPATGMVGVISTLEALTHAIEQPPKDGEVMMPTAANNPLSLLEPVVRFLQTLNQRGQPITQSAPADEQIEQLRKVIELIVPIVNPAGGDATGGDKEKPLGQVNGALGETIGNLLDGRKTAVGTIGALLTSLLSSTAGTSTNVGGVLTGLAPAAGLSQFAMPIFLALAFWGLLGKLEKWAQRDVPASPIVK
jgi:peptidoglycan hydrolase-like protein with peptidoglycan-binding domain